MSSSDETSTSPTPSDSPDQSDNQLESTATANYEPAFGWTPYAETINGRFAMIGFTALIILELVTHQDFFTWLGIR
ncbi:MAG TPA: chlorophyll a/b-binding protein [Elainellaceae cyanobacterium]